MYVHSGVCCRVVVHAVGCGGAVYIVSGVHCVCSGGVVYIVGGGGVVYIVGGGGVVYAVCVIEVCTRCVYNTTVLYTHTMLTMYICAHWHALHTRMLKYINYTSYILCRYTIIPSPIHARYTVND